jgi:hypothetical protein
MLLQLYSQVMSSRHALDVISDTRIIANTMVKTVTENSPASASFLRVLMRTFQSTVNGMQVTKRLLEGLHRSGRGVDEILT